MNSDNTTLMMYVFGKHIQETIFYGYIFISLLLVSFILLIISLKTERKHPLVRICGFAMVVTAVLFAFVTIPDVRNILVGLSSLIALVFSVVSLRQSEQIRKENLTKDDKDRKERLEREIRNKREEQLRDIVNWAIEVPSAGLKDYPSLVLITDNHNAYSRELKRIVLSQYQIADMKGEHIENLCAIFQPQLRLKVAGLRKELKNYIEEILLDKVQVVNVDAERRKTLFSHTAEIIKLANNISAELLK
jgi:hypothetical protein